MYTKKVNDGYFTKTVTYDKNLAFCPSGSCGIVKNSNGINLVSYTTVVCTIDNMGFLTCTCTYSNTTRKHIGAFLKEYAPRLSYYDVKKAYENRYAINIFTGEIEFFK